MLAFLTRIQAARIRQLILSEEPGSTEQAVALSEALTGLKMPPAEEFDRATFAGRPRLGRMRPTANLVFRACVVREAGGVEACPLYTENRNGRQVLILPSGYGGPPAVTVAMQSVCLRRWWDTLDAHSPARLWADRLLEGPWFALGLCRRPQVIRMAVHILSGRSLRPDDMPHEGVRCS